VRKEKKKRERLFAITRDGGTRRGFQSKLLAPTHEVLVEAEYSTNTRPEPLETEPRSKHGREEFQMGQAFHCPERRKGVDKPAV